jgi:F0F1-type ATP synthase membrane subunit b/b'
MLGAQNDDIRQARTEARRASQAAKENGTKSSTRKRDEMNDDQEETFSDAHTGLTYDEDQYLRAVEEQPAVWPILRRRGGRAGGSKRVKIVD